MKWFTVYCGIAVAHAYIGESFDNKKCFGKKVSLNEEPIPKTLVFSMLMRDQPLALYCQEYYHLFDEKNFECVPVQPRTGEYLTKVNWHKHDCYALDVITKEISPTVTHQYYEVEELYRSEALSGYDWQKDFLSEEGLLAEAIKFMAAEGIVRPGKTAEEELQYAAELEKHEERERHNKNTKKQLVNRYTAWHNLKSNNAKDAYIECLSAEQEQWINEKHDANIPYKMTTKESEKEIKRVLGDIEKIQETYPRNFSTEECNQLMKRPLDLQDKSLEKFIRHFARETPETVKAEDEALLAQLE